MTLKRAILLLKKEFIRANALEYVRNPVAWALYQVWKIADKEGE